MGDPLVFPALFFLYLLFLTVKGQAVKLTRTEYAILKLLMENPKQVIAKSVLLDRISLDTPDCTERSLKQHISNLRKKCRMSVVQIILKLYGALVSNFWQEVTAMRKQLSANFHRLWRSQSLWLFLGGMVCLASVFIKVLSAFNIECVIIQGIILFEAISTAAKRKPAAAA